MTDRIDISDDASRPLVASCVDDAAIVASDSASSNKLESPLSSEEGPWQPAERGKTENASMVDSPARGSRNVSVQDQLADCSLECRLLPDDYQETLVTESVPTVGEGRTVPSVSGSCFICLEGPRRGRGSVPEKPLLACCSQCFAAVHEKCWCVFMHEGDGGVWLPSAGKRRTGP